MGRLRRRNGNGEEEEEQEEEDGVKEVWWESLGYLDAAGGH